MPPKNLQLTIAWMVLATLLMGVAAWQAQVTVAREAAAKHATLPPPLKTRHAVRPVTDSTTGDVVENYIARCKKGMTLKEIEWALEDFANAGLSGSRPGSAARPPEVREFRERQALWYLQCLKEALHLNREQSAEALTTMSKQLQVDHDLRKELLQKHRDEEVRSTTDIVGKVNLVWSQSLSDDPFTEEIPQQYMPWNLCKLTESQEKITWKHWHDLAFPRASASTGINAIVERPEFLEPRKLAEKTGGPVFLLSSPSSDAMPGEDTPNKPPAWTGIPNRILPILAEQNLVEPVERGVSSEDPFKAPSKPNDETLLTNVCRLHPAQFKMLLLLHSGMAAEASNELQRASR